MKKLILIGGAMGAGKTTVCQKLKPLLAPSAFLDGDWCWDMEPFRVTDAAKAMVMDNIAAVLSNLLRCPDFESVLFCWVLPERPPAAAAIARRGQDAEMLHIEEGLRLPPEHQPHPLAAVVDQVEVVCPVLQNRGLRFGQALLVKGKALLIEGDGVGIARVRRVGQSAEFDHGQLLRISFGCSPEA